MSGARLQLRSSDLDTKAQQLSATNDILLVIQQRLGDLEALSGLFLIDPFVIQTLASTAYGQAPFPLRVSLPSGINPAGVVLAGIEDQTVSGAPAAVAHDVKWQVKPGGGGILVRHIPGLAVSTKYLVRLVVIRG